MTCSKQKTKKYTDRKGPPYSATDCEGSKKKGNDGLMYVSEKRGSSKSFKWYKVASVAKKSAKLSKSTKRRSMKLSKKSKSTKKSRSTKANRIPKFVDALNDLNKTAINLLKSNGFDVDDNYLIIQVLTDKQIKEYIKDKNLITGDIINVGTTYESRPEYGVGVVDLNIPGKIIVTEDFYSYSPHANSDKEIIEELTKFQNDRNALTRGLHKNAIKGYIKWAK